MSQITSFNPTATGIIAQIQGMLMQNGYMASEAKAVAFYTISDLIQKQAYVEAFDFVLAVAALVAVAAIVLVIFMRNKIPPEVQSATVSPAE